MKTVFELEEKPTDYVLFKEENQDNLDLETFLRIELNINNQQQLNEMIKRFQHNLIYSLEDLMKIKDWDEFGRNIPGHADALQPALDRYRNTSAQTARSQSVTDKRSKGELMNDWNKVKLFLFFESNMPKELNGERFGFIDKQALKEGFEEQRKDPEFDGGPILNDIEKVIEHFTEPEKPLRQNSHGMLLYGPPGTGKTQLCSVIIRKAGLFGLVPPLSSSELNRSKVGETEQLLMAIFHRALYVPYLLCCIAIDEVDALTPKRNEKSGEHKVDVLCLLLSLIGGIKDVPNVFVIASTNRLNKIDEAFARRLRDKFYVGRLNAEQRLNLIKKILEKNVDLAPHVTRTLNFDATSYQPRIELYNLLTTNFSGAAMVALRSEILHFFDLNRKNMAICDIDDKTLIDLCSKVANDFSIKIGGYSIADLLKENNIKEMSKRLRNCFEQGEKENLTGRVLIDLRPNIRNIQFERKDGSLKEVNLNEEKRFASDLVPILLLFAIIFDVPYFQLIDTELILSNAAYDENTAIEIILEKYSEYKQYVNAMFVYDADTLVGISESMSDSSMNESLSYSIQNSRIWQQIILQSFKANFALKEDTTSNNQRSYLPSFGSPKSASFTDHKWCVLISSSEFLISQFKRLVKFEYCQVEADLLVKERTCEQCGEKYVEKSNTADSCTYHPKPILEKFIKNSKNQVMSHPSTKEDLLKNARSSGDTNAFNEYFYLCCMKRFNECPDGCLKSKHKEKQPPRTSRRF